MRGQRDQPDPATPRPTEDAPKIQFDPEYIDGRGAEWIPKRRRHRHDCATNVPDQVPVEIAKGDVWVCPECRRRWRLIHKSEKGLPMNPFHASEGVSMTGPDGSEYWRPYRARFIGGIATALAVGLIRAERVTERTAP